MQRYYRSIKERIYLLSAEQSEEKFEFKVRGSSLNIYNQTLDPYKFKCSCPDHETRETFCKHLLFIVGKVAEQTTMARNLCVYQELWDKDHFTIVSEDLVKRLKSRSQVNKKEIKNNENENLSNMEHGDCPICFEDMKCDEELYKCKYTCKNFFHYECIRKWSSCTKRDTTCPLCRTSIELNNNENDYIDKNIETKFIDN